MAGRAGREILSEVRLREGAPADPARRRHRGEQARVELVFDRAAGEARALFVCAHGAGGHKNDRALQALVPRLCRSGLDVVRFDFPYREKGSRRPDAMSVLVAAFTDVVREVRQRYPVRHLILGGRSMGGRAATMLAAQGFACDALLLFAYPLHPAGEPEKLRAAHLRGIRVPVLCINGTADRLCRRDLMEQVVQTVSAPWRMHWLERADHSFHVPKSSARGDADVLEEAMQAIEGWLVTLWC